MRRRHLHPVPPPEDEPGEGSGLLEGAGPEEEAAHLDAVFAAADAILEQIDAGEGLAAVRGLYFDADGMPQLRQLRVRPVPTPARRR